MGVTEITGPILAFLAVERPGNSGFWVLGSGFWVLGSGFWALDANWIKERTSEHR